jgi:hypothetical protein
LDLNPGLAAEEAEEIIKARTGHLPYPECPPFQREQLAELARGTSDMRALALLAGRFEAPPKSLEWEEYIVGCKPECGWTGRMLAAAGNRNTVYLPPLEIDDARTLFELAGPSGPYWENARQHVESAVLNGIMSDNAEWVDVGFQTGLWGPEKADFLKKALERVLNDPGLSVLQRFESQLRNEPINLARPLFSEYELRIQQFLHRFPSSFPNLTALLCRVPPPEPFQAKRQEDRLVERFIAALEEGNIGDAPLRHLIDEDAMYSNGGGTVDIYQLLGEAIKRRRERCDEAQWMRFRRNADPVLERLLSDEWFAWDMARHCESAVNVLLTLWDDKPTHRAVAPLLNAASRFKNLGDEAWWTRLMLSLRRSVRELRYADEPFEITLYVLRDATTRVADRTVRDSFDRALRRVF